MKSGLISPSRRGANHPSSTEGRAMWRGLELGAAGAGQRAIRALGAEPARIPAPALSSGFWLSRGESQHRG